MNSRGLKIALAASVALNVFAAAGAVAAWSHLRSVETRSEEVRRAPRGEHVLAVVDELEPASRERVKEAMRTAALAARPDFEEARSTRRQAVDLARGETFDPAAANALLRRSREAELRGRERLETESVAILETLAPAERQSLAAILQRHRQKRRDGDGQGRPVPRGAAPTKGSGR